MLNVTGEENLKLCGRSGVVLSSFLSVSCGVGFEGESQIKKSGRFCA